jgi:hypothetical protein
MNKAAIAALRVLLVLMGAGLVLVQLWIIPIIADECALVFPELAYLQMPMTALAILTVGLLEVILGCIWLLLRLIARERIFSDRAYRYVDGIVAAAVVFATILFGVCLYLGNVVNANPPGLALALLGGVIGGLGLAALMIVMKGLLRQAHGFRDELELVI